MRLLYLEQNDSSGSYDMGLQMLSNIEKYTSIPVESVDINEIYRTQPRIQVIDTILTRVKEFKIDVVMIALDHRIILSTEAVQKLRETCALVCYLGDDEHYAQVFYNTYCQLFDLILCSNYFPIAKYEAMGLNSIFFPSSFDVDFSEEIKGPYEFDISFVGALRGKAQRMEYINALKESGLKVVVFGKDSGAGPVTREEMFRIFRKSKINLNFTGIAQGTVQDRSFHSQTRFKQIKGRCQEVALSGGFILTEYAYGIEKLFRPDKEFAIFKDSYDLVEKCKFYLAHDELRESIAASGHEVASNNYAARHAWKRFEQEVRKLTVSAPRASAECAADRAFWQYLNAQLIARAIVFSLNFNFRSAVLETSQIHVRKGFDVAMTAHIIKRELKLFRRRQARKKGQT